MTGATKDDQYERLLGYIVGNQASWFVDIGLKAGIFRAIADTGRGIGDGDLAVSLGFEPRYVGAWCRGAYAFGLLEWAESSGYRLAPHMESLLLDAADPRFMVDGSSSR